MNNISNYGIKDFWYIPFVIILYSILAFFSFKNNNEKTTIWFISSALIGMVPLWALVSSYSKNILFDSLLYDIIQLLTYVIVTGILVQSSISFNKYQYFGILLIIIGFIIMRVFSE
jgi:hypothetical protein